MTHSSRFVAFCLLFGAITAPPIAPAQCDPVTWTREQDHADMMHQLGIAALRPGPSGRAPEGAPNAANYDPAKANPYPDLPDALTMRDGRKVATAQMWREQRRPEIVEDFERQVSPAKARSATPMPARPANSASRW